MRVLVTGAQGFVGKNLMVRLAELDGIEAFGFTRADDPARLPGLVQEADAVIHLAGENRPADVTQFELVNAEFTRLLCDAVRASLRTRALVFTSSIQADRDNPYGRSKQAGEAAVAALGGEGVVAATILRLPNIFGKWCRPNYNSAVATFCHNIARGLPVRIDDPAAALRLVYIDDVVSALVDAAKTTAPGVSRTPVAPEYATTVGHVAEQIAGFAKGRSTLLTDAVGVGLTRALYATYVSYLPTSDFSYTVPQHGDARGVFVEMLKTPDSGQFSYFTAHPGVTRGGHYHHSKTEKFLVIRGSGRFRFRHLLNDEQVELIVHADDARIVETIPGWSHDVTNVGDDELIVMLWANEIFDRARPDTIAADVF
jgi:UDP-2-acetamido-2,6-beta-L-arabino-hexul-4-ose reductase